MLKPFDASAMRAYPVRAGSAMWPNDDAECAAPVEIAQEQARCSRGCKSSRGNKLNK